MQANLQHTDSGINSGEYPDEHNTVASKFLGSVWGADDRGRLSGVHYIAEPTQAGWRHHPVYTVAEAVRRAQEISDAGKNAYFACAEYLTDDNRKGDNVSRVRALWLDIDCGADKSAKGEGYSTKAEAHDAMVKLCEEAGLPMSSALVNSGHGLHVYWVLGAEVLPEEWRAYSRLWKAMTAKYGFRADPARTADIASVMRVPGTMNWKDPANPKPVELKYLRGVTEWAEIKAILDAARSEMEAIVPPAAGNSGDLTAGLTRGHPPMPETSENVGRIRRMLAAIPADCGRDEWRNVVWAVQAIGWPSAPEIAREWSMSAPEKYDKAEFDKVVASFNPSGGISFGTLVHHAKKYGWAEPGSIAGERFTGSGGPTEERESHGDVLNAGYFVQQHGERFRHAPQAGKWLTWNGGVWEWCERNEPLNAAENVVSRLLEYGGKLLGTETDRGKRIIGHAVKSHTVQKMEAMTKLAAARPGMSVLLHELDSDPGLLGVRNGVVDLRTGELLQARPDMLITRQCNAAYDKFAECPQWLGFLNAVFDGDSDTIETIQRALGYTLTGSSTEEKLFICFGRGANGKSVFANVVASILGDYGQTAPSSLLVTRREGDTGARNDLAMLAGARYVGINELQNGDRLDEAIVKQLAGREPISARFLHREFFTFAPQFTPWLRTNHRPVVTGDDDGIWRRLVLIPFKRQFAESERDPHLEERLLSERDGILAWMVEGATKWRRDGLKLSPTIKRESLAYRKESDLLGEFLEDKCELDPNARVEQGKLFSSWQGWCEAAGVRHGAKASFTRRLVERGIAEARSNGTRFYVGVTFR